MPNKQKINTAMLSEVGTVKKGLSESGPEGRRESFRFKSAGRALLGEGKRCKGSVESRLAC